MEMHIDRVQVFLVFMCVSKSHVKIMHIYVCEYIAIFIVHTNSVTINTSYHSKDLCVARCIHASESGTALAKGLGQMSLVNNYQTFRPNLGSSSVVVRLQGKVTYISVGGGAGEITVGGKIMGGKLGVWEVT